MTTIMEAFLRFSMAILLGTAQQQIRAAQMGSQIFLIYWKEVCVLIN